MGPPKSPNRATCASSSLIPTKMGNPILWPLESLRHFHHPDGFVHLLPGGSDDFSSRSWWWMFGQGINSVGCSGMGHLVGGFSPTPLKHMRKSNWIISPRDPGWKLKNMWKTPPSHCIHLYSVFIIEKSYHKPWKQKKASENIPGPKRKDRLPNHDFSGASW